MTKLLKGNSINRRVAGPMMVDLVEREFEVEAGNYSSTVHVHPRFMDRAMEVAGENDGRVRDV